MIEIARERRYEHLRPRRLAPRAARAAAPALRRARARRWPTARSSRRSTWPRSSRSRGELAERGHRGDRDLLPAQLHEPRERAGRARRRSSAPRRTCASRSPARSCPRSASSSAPRRRVANVYVQDRVERYLRRPRGAARARSASGGRLRVMLSNGGDRDRAGRRRRASRCGCSSPARRRARSPRRAFGGRSGVRRPDLVRHGRHDREALPDRGRRAADRARVRGRPRVPLQARLRACRSRRRSIDMIEIGAGGGSIARVDALGLLAVGPDSAGADPGPACYGAAAARADRHRRRPRARLPRPGLLPRRADDARRRRGARRDRRRASPTPLGLTRRARPRGASTALVNENMANAARVHAVERGNDPRPACRCSPSAAPGRCTRSASARRSARRR